MDTVAIDTPPTEQIAPAEPFRYGRQTLILADCLDWLATAEHNSISGVLTDPPYGLVEYSEAQQQKLRAGRGGVWRIPPSFDGAERRPLPRFTVLTADERTAIVTFFTTWAGLLLPVMRPGGHLLVASNPLVSPLVAWALEGAGFERRGEIVRLVRTFRGGDRPKGAEEDFPMVSTMPRSAWEPWGLYRKPISERTVADNLRKWGTGGLRRRSEQSPPLDVIPSGITPDRERAVAPHPSVKPQAFLREMARSLLPMGPDAGGVILDPFAGCATTLAACEAIGATGIGLEIDPTYWAMASESIPKLAALPGQGDAQD
jgi:DNA modification methylase